MTPALTRSGLVLLLAYGTFFLTLLQRLKTLKDVDAMLRLMGQATVLMAVIGLGQLFFGNGRFLWIIEHPLRDTVDAAKGTFTNQNHFAHFLALGIGPLVWWWKSSGANQGEVIQGHVKNRGFGISRSTDSLQKIIAGAIAVVLFAGVLTYSRGGIAVLSIAVLIAMASVGKMWKAILRLAVPVVLFLAAAIAIFGTIRLESKWNSLTQATSWAEISEGRLALWGALLTATRYFWPVGAGVGSHAEVYPTWMKEDLGVRMSHAESSYMQILIETGLPGLLLSFVALGVCIFWITSAWRNCEGDARGRVIILTSCVVVTFVHSLVDFVWYIPACTVFGLIAIACLFRTHQIHNKVYSGRKTSWATVWAFIIVISAVPVGRLSSEVVRRDAGSEAAWLTFRGESVVAGRSTTFNSTEAFDDRLESMIHELESCVQADPSDFRASSNLAALYLRRFAKHQQTAENRMSVKEIRDTVKDANFESSRHVAEWLHTAFGSPVADLYRSLLIAERSLQGQPLRAENYLILAELGFLKGMSAEDENRLIDQAIRLRPHKASVLYAAGHTRAVQGEFEQAFEFWSKAFHIDKDLSLIHI